jgi:pyruvate ferredoxin oxidoreductase gamma subunit
VYRIRFHGRGGQGVKTAGRVLGSAFFAEGFEVQDAPRYGAERRGAPLFAYVRAARRPIQERGPIRDPDLVVVADDSLVGLPAAGVLLGADAHTVLLLDSELPAEEWRRRTAFPGPILTLSGQEEGSAPRHGGVACAGAAARCVGVLSAASLEHAVRLELEDLRREQLEAGLAQARRAFEALAEHAGCVVEHEPRPLWEAALPDWVDLPFEAARVSAPHIHAPVTSLEARTGEWRTLRPVLDRERCHLCHWICTTFCPDSVIAVDAEGAPEIDYEHCKGCLVCVAVCPHHALDAVPEPHPEPIEGASASGDAT